LIFSSPLLAEENFPVLSDLILKKERGKLGIVNTDKVQIQNNSIIKAEKLATLNTNDYVIVYDKKGPEVFSQNILDYWYKISPTENKWINALNVTLFPLYFDSDGDLAEIAPKSIIIDRSLFLVVGNENINYWYQVKTGDDRTWICGTDIELLGPEKTRVRDFCKNPLKDSDLIWADQLIEQIKKFYGEPKKFYSDNSQNQEIPILRKYFIYPEIEFVLADSGERDILESIKISSNKIKMRWGLNVGVNKKDLLSVLGNPDEEKDNQLIYIWEFINGTQERISFEMDNDKVKAIYWKHIFE
jgi:hypothetical protein